MSFRWKRRGLRAVLMACAVIVGVLAGTTQFASAFVPCPSEGNIAGGISEWYTEWPTGSEDAKGVTLCHGVSGLSSKGYLQIVDLSDGAKIRLQTQVDPTSEYGSFHYGESHSPNTLFTKRTAYNWYQWIRRLPEEEEVLPQSIRPSPSRLFSVTNGGFFKSDENNERPTKVPFPVWNWGLQSSFGVSQNAEEEGPDKLAEKKALVIGSGFRIFGEETTQTVKVETFPRNYESGDPYTYLRNEGNPLGEEHEVADAIVGFTPEYVVGEAEEEYKNRRNYIGVYQNKVYIFTSDSHYTNNEAWEVLREIQPGIQVVQLDGGGSAQFYSAYGEQESTVPVNPREVPTVLAIYRGE